MTTQPTEHAEVPTAKRNFSTTPQVIEMTGGNFTVPTRKLAPPHGGHTEI